MRCRYCKAEGYQAIGVEMGADNFKIAHDRLEVPLEGLLQPSLLDLGQVG